MALKDRLKYARDLAGLSQRQLADAAETTQQMISKLETGESEETSLIGKLAIALNVNSDWLEFDKGPMARANITNILQNASQNILEFKKDKGMSDDKKEDSARNAKLGEIIDTVAPLRTAPIVGSIIKNTEGVIMLVEADLGSLQVHSHDPDVRCYEENSDVYSPRIRPREIIIVEPNAPLETHDDAFVMLKNNTLAIYEYLSEDDEYYTLGDILLTGKRIRLKISEVKNIWAITDVNYKAKHKRRPINPNPGMTRRKLSNNTEPETK